MFLLNPKSGSIIKRLFPGILLITFLLIHTSLLYGQETVNRPGLIKGRITQYRSGTPVCMAGISCGDGISVAMSNVHGEFVLDQVKFPAKIRIKKFGFREETVTVEAPGDSVNISLVPLMIMHRNTSGDKKPFRYGLILNKAVEKLRANDPVNAKEEMVYYNITSASDTSFNSLFEGYSHMRVSMHGFLDYQPDISRYATEAEYIPGLSQTMLEIRTDPFLALPMFVEKYFRRTGYFVQDGKRIAMVKIDLGLAKDIYYVNIEDTSLIYFTSRSKSGKKYPVPGSKHTWHDNRYSTTEISFSGGRGLEETCMANYLCQNETFRLIQKDKPDQVISKNTLVAVVPDSSGIINAVRDQILAIKNEYKDGDGSLLFKKSAIFNKTENLVGK